MAEEIIIIIISIVVILGIMVSVKFKQPMVFWILLMGALIGPFGLGLIQNNDTIKTLGEFGAILLLFTLGVKFSIQKLIKQGFIPILLTSIKLFFIGLMSFFFISLMGFNFLTSLIFSLIISITSTTIVVKIIEQRGWVDSNDVNFVVN